MTKVISFLSFFRSPFHCYFCLLKRYTFFSIYSYPISCYLCLYVLLYACLFICVRRQCRRQDCLITLFFFNKLCISIQPFFHPPKLSYHSVQIYEVNYMKRGNIWYWYFMNVCRYFHVKYLL